MPIWVLQNWISRALFAVFKTTRWPYSTDIPKHTLQNMTKVFVCPTVCFCVFICMGWSVVRHVVHIYCDTPRKHWIVSISNDTKNVTSLHFRAQSTAVNHVLCHMRPVYCSWFVKSDTCIHDLILSSSLVDIDAYMAQYMSFALAA